VPLGRRYGGTPFNRFAQADRKKPQLLFERNMAVLDDLSDDLVENLVPGSNSPCRGRTVAAQRPWREGDFFLLGNI
jgi:hypothetical protein